jgi:uncharacterized protein YjiS (DUF1127 family)
MLLQCSIAGHECGSIVGIAHGCNAGFWVGYSKIEPHVAMHHELRSPAMSLINLFVVARNALAERHRRRRAYDELMALDDRSLADIGMHRSQIPAMVEAMYQDAQPHPVSRPAHSPRGPRLVTGHR